MGGVASAGFEGILKDLRFAVLCVNTGTLARSANREPEGPGVLVGAIVIITTFSAGSNNGEADAGVIAGAKILGGFSPEMGKTTRVPLRARQIVLRCLHRCRGSRLTKRYSGSSWLRNHYW